MNKSELAEAEKHIVDPISVRVQYLETGLQDVRNSIQQQGVAFNAALGTMSDRLNMAINNVASDLKKRSEIPWQGLSVMMGAIAIIGAMAYWPVRENQADFKMALRDVATAQAGYLSRDEAEVRSARSKEDRDRVERTLAYFQDNVFPREVHVQRWARFDSDIAAVRHDMDLQVENLERQIEQLQKAQSDTYTARDAIIENKDQIRRLEEQIRSMIERKYP